MEDKGRTRTLVLCFITYAVVYTGRLNLSIAAPGLLEQGILTETQIGILGSSFFIIYALGRLLNGMYGDRLPTRPILIVGLFFSGVCNLIMAILPGAWVMYVAWGFNGLFQSMLWGPLLSAVTSAYENHPMLKRAVSIMSISVGTGTVLGIALPTLYARIGLEAVFLIPGICIVFIAGLLFFLLPASEGKKGEKSAAGIFALSKDRTLIRLLVPSAAHGLIKENLTLWVPLFFITAYGMDLPSATGYIFMMPLATFLGRILFPLWYRLMKGSYRKSMIGAFALCAAVLLPLALGTLPPIAAGFLMAVTAMCTSIINAILMSVYPAAFHAKGQVSAVAGIVDFAAYVGSTVGAAAFGYLTAAVGYTGVIAVWCGLAVASIAFIWGIQSRSKQKAPDNN